MASMLRPNGAIWITRISSTIIAPTPLLAAYFIIVGRLIVLLGPQYSRLKPSLCKGTLFLSSLRRLSSCASYLDNKIFLSIVCPSIPLFTSVPQRL